MSKKEKLISEPAEHSESSHSNVPLKREGSGKKVRFSTDEVDSDTPLEDDDIPLDGDGDDDNDNTSEPDIDSEREVEDLAHSKKGWGCTWFFLGLLVVMLVMAYFQENYDSGYEEWKSNFEILGLLTTASENDIKQAYKKLAMKLHPDKNPNCEHCTEQFIKVTDAYKTILDKRGIKIYEPDEEPIILKRAKKVHEAGAKEIIIPVTILLSFFYMLWRKRVSGSSDGKVTKNSTTTKTTTSTAKGGLPVNTTSSGSEDETAPNARKRRRKDT